MSKVFPAIPLRIRYLAIILGMLFFLWIPIEDTSEIPALLFAMATSAWLATTFLARVNKSFPSILLNYLLMGTLAGIAVTPLTLTFMAVKTGLHGHSAPDFTTQQMISIIRRTPIWLVGGFLIGLGSGLWFSNRLT